MPPVEILVSAGAGGLVPLAGVVLRLSLQNDAAQRRVVAGNPWTWVWHVLFLPAAAIGYAVIHEDLGTLDMASAFELGIGIPLVLKTAIDKATGAAAAKPGQ